MELSINEVDAWCHCPGKGHMDIDNVLFMDMVFQHKLLQNIRLAQRCIARIHQCARILQIELIESVTRKERYNEINMYRLYRFHIYGFVRD
jgi:hypothetical protein